MRTLLLSKAVCVGFFFLWHTFFYLVFKFMSCLYARVISSLYQQLLLCSFLSLLGTSSYLIVILLDGRDDPDASSHPTRHVTCLRQHKRVSYFSSKKEKENWEPSSLTAHYLWVCKIDFGSNMRSGCSGIISVDPYAVVFLQYTLLASSEISRNDDNMMQ